MEKHQGQLPYHAPAMPSSTAPTLFVGILEVTAPAKKMASRPKKAPPAPAPPGRRVTFLDICTVTKA